MGHAQCSTNIVRVRVTWTVNVFHGEAEESCCHSKTVRKCNFWETVRETQGKRFTMSEDSMNRPRQEPIKFDGLLTSQNTRIYLKIPRKQIYHLTSKAGSYNSYWLYVCATAIIEHRGSLPVTLLGYLNFKKVIFRTMRTMQKQFPVNWLTSGSEAESTNDQEKNGGPSGETLSWLKCPTSRDNLP